MKGRRAGGKSEKRRDRKTAKPKQSSGSHAHVRRTSSGIRKVADVQQLIQERDAALDQQAATSEILEVISRSTGDLQPIFAAILQNAVRLCDASFGDIYSWERGALHLLASYNSPPAFAEERRRSERIPPSPDSPTTRILATKSPVHIADLTKDGAYVEKRSQASIAAVELGGVRSFLGMPMLKENELIGILFLNRQFVRPFTDKQIDLVKNFAAEAVIAIENARLLNELREALEQQTATSEVLGVISSSPGDLEAVFRTMLENATRICEAKFGTLDLCEGGGLRLAAAHDVPPVFTEGRGEGPFQPAPGGILDTAMKTRRTVHIHDLATTDAYAQRHPRMVDAVEVAGIRTAVGVPMLKDEELVGIIAIFRQEVRPFTKKQIELFTNFANQAVIAIENARLLNELRQRTADLTASTTDLTEALEQQTATSEVLQVISSSPGDLEPVFATMLENATRICEAKFGVMQVLEGDGLRAVSFHDVPAAYAEAMRRDPVFRPVAGHPLDRVASTKQVVHIPDVRAEQRLRGWIVELAGARTLLCVPMLKDNTFVGVISIYRQEVRPFTDKQIALVQNFAAQAVIATENARLLNELRQRTTDLTDALEQQTATSEVLQAISRFPGDLQPVFAAMLENAVRICDATFGNIFPPETKAAVDRANLLIEQAEAIGEPPEDPLLLYSVLAGYAFVTGVAGNFTALRDVADRTFALAEKQQGSAPFVFGHNQMGASLMVTGEIAAGKAHFDQSIALYDPDEHRLLGMRFGSDGRALALVYRSIGLWMLGHPEAAVVDADCAIKKARAIGHATSLMMALSLPELTYMLCGNYAAGIECARELAKLADEKGSLSWKTVALSIEARHLALTGEPAKALPMATSARHAYELTGAKFLAPLDLSKIASIYAALGKFDDARRCIAEAMNAIEANKEKWFEGRRCSHCR